MVESFEIIWGGGAFVKVIITTEIFKVCAEVKVAREGWKMIVRVPVPIPNIGSCVREDRKLQTDYNFGECRRGHR